jgi:hypothetical protein
MAERLLHGLNVVERSKDGFWVISDDFVNALHKAGALNAHIAQVRAAFGEAAIGKAFDTEIEEGLVAKAATFRYTLMPVYAPDRQDAHGEWVSKSELHRSFVDFLGQTAKSATPRRVNLQHNEITPGMTIGRWEEAIIVPHDHTIKLTKGADATRTLTMPAGSAYMGVVWDADAFEKVRTGVIGGLSVGGRAIRSRGGSATLMHMGDARKSVIADAWAEVNAPIVDMLTELNNRLAVLEVQKAMQHAYVQKPGSDVCDVCGAPQEADVHGPPLEGFGDTDGDVSTSRLPWVHVS